MSTRAVAIGCCATYDVWRALGLGELECDRAAAGALLGVLGAGDATVRLAATQGRRAYERATAAGLDASAGWLAFASAVHKLAP